MHLELFAAPTDLPLTLDEVKNHLRVWIDQDNDLVSGLLAAATSLAETKTRRCLLTQTWDLFADSWEELLTTYTSRFYNSAISPIWYPRIILPYAPVQSIDEITYVDLNGVSQIWDASLYQFTTGTPGKVAPLYNQILPALQPNTPDAVRIRFTAGYPSAADVPSAIKSAMLLLIGNLYENRESNVVGTTVTKLPDGVEALLSTTTWGGFA